MKEFVRLELELVLTFVKLAHTKYSMGHIAGGNVSRSNANKAYRSALRYLRKCHDVTSLESRTLTSLINQAKDAIATLPKAATKRKLNSN
jgi:hypothetical protein